MLKLQVVLLLKASLSLALNYFESNPVIAFECDPLRQMITIINAHYFEQQESVSIIDFSGISTGTIMMCVQTLKYMPVYILTDPWRIKLGEDIDKSSVSSYPKTEGVMFKCYSTQAQAPLAAIASHNPRAKLLIFLISNSDGKSQNEANMKKVLSDAFHVHEILDVAVLMVTDEYEGEKYLKTITKMMLYNPFSENKGLRRPEFMNIVFNETHFEEQVQEMKDFISSRVKNLHGYPLRVSIFEYPMISKPQYDSDGEITHYSYIDGETLTIMSKFINFTPIYTKSNTSSSYGMQLSNGTFVGSLGDVEDGFVDISANPKFIANYNTTRSVFLQPVAKMTLFFIIPKRKTSKYLIISVFRFMDSPSKATGLLLIALYPLSYFMINRLEQYILASPKQKISIDESLLFILGLLCNTSRKLSKLPATRVLIGSVLLHALVFSSLFQSTIVKYLNANQVLGKITSIEELADEDYKVKIPGHVAMVFKSRNGLDKVTWLLNKTKQSLSQTLQKSCDFKEIFRNDEKIAFLWTDMYQSNYLDRYFDNNTGDNLYESVPEKAFEFFISIMVPKNSPFIEAFNEFLIIYTELGFGQHFKDQAYNDNEKIMIQRIKNGQVPKHSTQSIKLDDFLFLFELYLWMSFSSCLIFVSENIYLKIFKSKYVKQRFSVLFAAFIK